MDRKAPLAFNSKKMTLQTFKKKYKVKEVIDKYDQLVEELFLIRNPRHKFSKDYSQDLSEFKKKYLGKNSSDESGSWFYFSWNGLLIHYLPDADHQEIRTARNKNIITKEEQEKFYNFKVGIAGLSVGSHAALTLTMMGGAKTIKLADPDEISGSNLNRIRYDYTYVGKNKCDVAVEHIYQMNPYADVGAYPMGVTVENLADFLSGPPKIDVLVEEMDNLEMKIRIRLAARKLGIPVVMATDNADNVIVDIERYDLDPNLKLFNGVAGDLTLEEFQSLKPQDMPLLATKIAGPHMVMPRMQASLLEVGKTLYSWPQLGDAATLSGVAVSYIVKRLALGENLKTGKLEINLDSIFDPNYNSTYAQKQRETDRKGFFSKIRFEE